MPLSELDQTPVTPDRAPTGTERPAAELLGAIALWQRDAIGVLVVAIDGHGGSGKTTIARAVADAGGFALVHTDDFFRQPAPGRLHPIGAYYESAALRDRALQPLRAGLPARFPHRHWEDPHAAGRPVRVAPRPVVLLEGVFAAAREHGDLVDRTVLVRAPDTQRLQRLRGRVSPEEWDADWLEAEARYLAALPVSAFDLVLSGAAEGTAP